MGDMGDKHRLTFPPVRAILNPPSVHRSCNAVTRRYRIHPTNGAAWLLQARLARQVTVARAGGSSSWLEAAQQERQARAV